MKNEAVVAFDLLSLLYSQWKDQGCKLDYELKQMTS